MSELHAKIDELITLYNNDSYVMSRLETFIMSHLPNSLASASELHKERNERRERLLSSGDIFADQFLANSNVSYCPRIELFVCYDKEHFIPISEDDIQHMLLTQITTNQELVPWKHKLKNSVIKSLKERSPLECIPESATIQFVLNQLYPAVFHTKNAAKHFLTAVGDCIKGEKTNTYIVTSGLRDIMREIETAHYNCFGSTNILANFKLRYHGHSYELTRFFQSKLDSNTLRMPHKLAKHMIDMLCVASHYSDRYGSADNFVNTSNDETLKQICMFSKDLTVEKLAINFKESALYECNDSSVTNKNMLFILKKYLDDHNIPNIVFHEAFSEQLRKLVNFSPQSDSYTDTTSHYLPVVSSFSSFWDTHFKDDYGVAEYEVNEIIQLFIASTTRPPKNVSEEFIIDLLKHIAPEITIEDDKYIFGVSCDLWDKRGEVSDFMIYIGTMEESKTPTHLSALYSLYTSWKSTICMSKNCFEKLVKEIQPDE
uniref:Uncharacterized protein n=1 Tax=viral metagenome TaxID=1070528 RepID=A0A6C0LK14_9ZZZZ